MTITMAAIIFLNFHAMPIIRLLIRIISDFAAYYNYLSDFNKILYGSQLKDTMVTIIFQNSYTTPLIRLLIRVISDLKVTCNYLSD